MPLKHRTNLSLAREYVLGNQPINYDLLTKELKDRNLLEKAEKLFDKFSKEIENEFISEE